MLLQSSELNKCMVIMPMSYLIVATAAHGGKYQGCVLFCFLFFICGEGGNRSQIWPYYENVFLLVH